MSKHYNGNGAFINKDGLCVRVRNNDVRTAISKLKRLFESEGMVREFRDIGAGYQSPGQKRRQKKMEGTNRCKRRQNERAQELGISGPSRRAY